MSEIYQYDHKSPEELAAIIRPQMIGTEEFALDALTALQSQAEFPRYDALRQALQDATREGDEWKRASLTVLAENERLRAELERWLAWSGGQYPDDSPGDVIAAEADGTIVLDDAITTWNPLRALAFLAGRT